jgi:hypothetical protein
MVQSTPTVANFTGTLLRHEHKLGQKFVQLVFREADKNVLCVSTDPRTATLMVGQTYHVEGTFKYRGERPFVYDPAIAPLKKNWIPSLSRRNALIASGLFVIIILSGAMLTQSSPAKAAKAASTQSISQTAVHKPVTPPAPAATATPTPAPVYYSPVVLRQVSKPKSTPTPTTTTTTPSAPSVVSTPTATSPTAPAASATPASDVCTTETIAFTIQSMSDTSVAGTVLQSGVNGSEQVCTISGTTVTTQPVSEIISTGPATQVS